MLNRKAKIAIGIAVLLIAGTAGFAAVKISSDKIAPNTVVNGIDLGGMTVEEAEKSITVFENENVYLKYNNKSYDIKLKDINFKYNIEKTAEDAYMVNRSGNIFSNMFGMIQSHFGKENEVNIAMYYNREKADEKIKEISKDIDKDAENATFKINAEKTKLIPEKNGVKVNLDKTKNNMTKQLSKNKFTAKVSVNENIPDITTKDLEGIDTALGTSSTTFKLRDENRSHNVMIATEAASGVILKPGEEYSFNTVVGKRSSENGYKNAPVIMDGEMKQDLGGGVCQVSSTLYNAVLKSGMEIVTVKNHSIPSSYVGKGRDATVTDSGTDFVFKNQFDHPVYVQGYINGNTTNFQIVGAKSDKQNIEIETTILSTSPGSTQEVVKSDLPAGKKEVEKPTRTGYVVATYRVYKDKGGKEIKREKVATSTYPKSNGIVYVGSKPEEPKEEKPEQPGEGTAPDGGEAPAPSPAPAPDAAE